MSRRSMRKKSGDRRNRKDLYEKYIPYIGEAIGSIINKSRNHAFKMHCQELLQVEGAVKIQEAILSKLFMLTLGDQHNSDSTSHIQEDKKLDAACNTDAAFGDLAYHLESDCEQWSFIDKSCLENMDQEISRASAIEAISTRGNEQRAQPEGSLTKDSVETECHAARKKVENTHVALDAAEVANPDDHFESLDSDIMFNEFPSCNEVIEILDQKVPCCYQVRNDESDSYTNCQSVTAEQTSYIEETTPGENDHFETLGVFVQY